MPFDIKRGELSVTCSTPSALRRDGPAPCRPRRRSPARSPAPTSCRRAPRSAYACAREGEGGRSWVSGSWPRSSVETRAYRPARRLLSVRSAMRGIKKGAARQPRKSLVLQRLGSMLPLYHKESPILLAKSLQGDKSTRYSILWLSLSG